MLSQPLSSMLRHTVIRQIFSLALLCFQHILDIVKISENKPDEPCAIMELIPGWGLGKRNEWGGDNKHKTS